MENSAFAHDRGANMKRALVIVIAATLTGCASGGTSPGPAAYCMTYESYASCSARCSGMAAGPATCGQICTPGSATEPPNCTPVPGCEATQQAQHDACLGSCTVPPTECH